MPSPIIATPKREPLTISIIGEASIVTRLATSSTSAMRPIGIDNGAKVSASS